MTLPIMVRAFMTYLFKVLKSSAEYCVEVPHASLYRNSWELGAVSTKEVVWLLSVAPVWT